MTVAAPPPQWLFGAALEMRRRLAENPKDTLSRLLQFCLANAPLSSAQLLQDLFVLFALKNKRGGFFVEFGASDGVFGSNTVLLERQCGWSGILAEPARCWHAALNAQRQASIDPRCVWSTSGEMLTFTEAHEPIYSTLETFGIADAHAPNRIARDRYEVETVSLNDLLATHNAPQKIDYISVDTEGSEFEILKAFDFDRYRVSIITVEHNGVPELRDPLYALLTARGFFRVYEDLSQWDDWYVTPDVALG